MMVMEKSRIAVFKKKEILSCCYFSWLWRQVQMNGGESMGRKIKVEPLTKLMETNEFLQQQ
jgi:hypothetical protein